MIQDYYVTVAYPLENSPNEGELDIQVGDVIKVLNYDDPDWWEGEIDGHTGWFPRAYTTD